VSKIVYNIEKVLSRVHDNFEEQNKIPESSIIIIIINECIINKYCNYTINSRHDYYIS
jgi:hypothetical protein